MAFPTAVNSQITDAVTQTNVSVLAEAPAQAMGTLFQTVAVSISLSLENAVANQQNAYSLAAASTARLVAALTPNAGS